MPGTVKRRKWKTAHTARLFRRVAVLRIRGLEISKRSGIHHQVVYDVLHGKRRCRPELRRLIAGMVHERELEIEEDTRKGWKPA